jgi:uncharacterized Zn finger protein (UPF0148 family)
MEVGCGDVLTIHCPQCDVFFDERDDICAAIACPRCGHILREDVTARVVARKTNLQSTDRENFAVFDHGRRISLLGRPGILRWTKNVAIRLIVSACPRCGTQIRRGMAVCPCCGARLNRAAAPTSRFVRVVRKMIIAATIFIGVPAALIVFVLVVCAPEPEKAKRNSPLSGSVAAPESPHGGRGPREPERRGLSSGFRSVRDWLRGAKHHGGGPASKAPLEETGDRAEGARVPPVRTRDGAQVEPDPIR